MKWKGINKKIRFTIIFLICFSLLYSSYTLVNQYSEQIKDFIPKFLSRDTSFVFGDAEILPTLTANDKIIEINNITFTTKPDGTIKPNTIRGNNNIYIGFAITGKVNGINYTASLEDYNWTWEQVDYNVTRRRVNITRLDEALRRNKDINITEDLIDNMTFVLTNLTGINNNSLLNIEQQWTFDEERDSKLKQTITNNLGKDITNITYWFIFKLPKDFKIKYNDLDYNLNKSINIRIRNTRLLNLTRVNPLIDLGEIEFIYSDLLKNKFVVSDFYIGNGSIIGHPETLISAIGVSKGNGILANGETIILDPEVTDWKSPTRTGSFFNQWTSGTNIKVSDNAYAFSVTAVTNPRLSSDLYGFDSIPTGAQITGIEIRVEGLLDDPVSC